jgi:hypothetical protein
MLSYTIRLAVKLTVVDEREVERGTVGLLPSFSHCVKLSDTPQVWQYDSSLRLKKINK